MALKSERKQPFLNSPTIIIVCLVVLTIIHVYKTYFLSNRELLEFTLQYAFIPARYTNLDLNVYSPWAGYWTPLSYSFVHVDWIHLVVNGFWMLAFGSVVARRLGVSAFLLFSALGSIGGAFAHYISHIGELVPMIGASGIVSACMGGACRFAFPKGGRFSPDNVSMPIQTVAETFANSQAMTFMGFWFLINYVAGSGIIDLDSGSSQIAWQAHAGGFIVGFFLISALGNTTPRNEAY